MVPIFSQHRQELFAWKFSFSFILSIFYLFTYLFLSRFFFFSFSHIPDTCFLCTLEFSRLLTLKVDRFFWGNIFSVKWPMAFCWGTFSPACFQELYCCRSWSSVYRCLWRHQVSWHRQQHKKTLQSIHWKQPLRQLFFHSKSWHTVETFWMLQRHQLDHAVVRSAESKGWAGAKGTKNVPVVQSSASCVCSTWRTVCSKGARDSVYTCWKISKQKEGHSRTVRTGGGWCRSSEL